MAVKMTNKIEKRNFLNMMQFNTMTITELRFMIIYMSKINARNIDTRVVEFSLHEFKTIMNLGRLNIKHIKDTTGKLLQKIATIDREIDGTYGGYTQFQLFQDVDFYQKGGDWFVRIDCTQKALPLFFEFKREFFTYELWNALNLTSSNQIRMYEILKQHEKQVEWTCSVKELRTLLFLETTQYKQFERFRVRVLDRCQQALRENTDLSFDYEYIKKGRAVLKLKFKIKKNKKYVDKLLLSEFIASISTTEQKPSTYQDEFSKEQLVVLLDCVSLALQTSSTQDQERYLQRKYHEMCMRNPQRSRFGYLKKIIEADTTAKGEGGQSITPQKSSDLASIEEFWKTLPKLK